MRGHRDLVAWQKAMKLVTDVYKVTVDFPKHEIYGLTGQLRRSAISVPSNLAEGHGRNSRKDFHRFIGQARGSLTELETQLEIAENLGYLPNSSAIQLLAQASEIGKMLNGLRNWSQRELTPDS